MKKFRRILGRCALGAFLLAAVYSILVAAGVLFPAPPVVPESLGPLPRRHCCGRNTRAA